MLNISKLALAVCVMSTFAQFSYAQADKQLSPLEIADPDLPGGSYDIRIEKQKKIDQLKELTLEPQQIRDVKDILLQQQRDRLSPYSSIPTPTTRSLNVKFTPGAVPPVIRLSANMLSTIVFSDASGNPWNITNVSLNRNMFSDGSISNSIRQAENLQNDSNEKPQALKRVNNILSLEPLNPIAYGNMAVSLDGLDTPVIFILSTGQAEVDLRVDARIPGSNPSRTISRSMAFSGTTTHSIDDTTLLFVDGAPPETAVSLKASSQDVDAWIYEGEIVVRTDAQIIYPAFKASVTSASGMTVYRFDQETRALTISKGTSSKNVFIEME